MKISVTKEKLGEEWLPEIYRKKVRTQRTRAFILDLPYRTGQIEIQHTLLGIELKVGKKRFACPDLAMARYLRVFARLGCRQFAIPYDITTVSAIADELETAWQKTMLLVGTKSKRSALIKQMRTEIEEIGPGEAMPEFKPPQKRKTVYRKSL